MVFLSKIVYFFIFLIILITLSISPLFFKIHNANDSENIFLITKNISSEIIIYKNENKYKNYFLEIYFYILTKTNKMHYGEFKINKNDNMLQLIKKIYLNKRFARKIYIPSGANKFKIIEILNDKNHKITGNQVKFDDVKEGYIFPDTYHYYYGESRQNLIKTMTKKTVLVLDSFWENKRDDLPFKNKDEALTMASMIEKEAGNEKEKSDISSVFINRIKIGMKLESDPTSQYANKLNNFYRQNNGLEKESFNLKIASDYNTYYKIGLPIGPISNASYSSIFAAFNPNNTKYLYFISFPGDKFSIFTDSYEEHYKNVLLLRKKQKEIKNFIDINK